MKQRIIMMFVALIGLFLGYSLLLSTYQATNRVTAHPSAMPASSHLLYLSSEGVKRGQITDEALKNRGVTFSRTWQAAQDEAYSRPLDALLIDDTSFKTISDGERAWLQTQFHNGVVIVGLGVEAEQLSQNLGVTTSQASKAINEQTGSNEYFLAYSLILGRPDDIKVIRDSDWIAQSLNENAEPASGIKAPLVTLFGTASGDLDSTEGLDKLFKDVNSKIEGVYQTRAEYEQAVKDFVEQTYTIKMFLPLIKGAK